MQAVILAAGRGTRMGTLTESTPKPLLPLLGKRLIERTIENLPDAVTEVVIVVNYRKEDIMAALGNEYAGKKIRYVHQAERSGTASALHAAREHLGERFLVLMSDDVYSRESMEASLAHPYAITRFKVPSQPGMHSVIAAEDGTLARIGADEDGSWINTGLYTLGPAFFERDPHMLPGGEYSLPHTLAELAKQIPVQVLDADFWLQVNTPDDLAAAEAVLKERGAS